MQGNGSGYPENIGYGGSAPHDFDQNLMMGTDQGQINSGGYNPYQTDMPM
jgi:hypothetical protein